MSDPPRSALAGLRVAYVVQLYPKVSHVFIQREVAALRAAGAEVDTYSLRRPSPSDVLSDVDRDETARTTSLRPVDAVTFLQVHLRALIRNPRAYLATLASAVGAAPSGVKARIWQVFYFAQAVLLLDQLRRRRARHVHAHLANVATDVTWFAVELANRSGSERWSWSFTMHGPTEFHAVEEFNLTRKVAAADLVVCISDYCRSQLMAITDPSAWPKLRIVHCGVDLDRYVPIDRGERVPSHLLSVGRLVPEKAQSLVLEVVAELVRRGHDGDGDHRRRRTRPRTPPLPPRRARAGISGRPAGCTGPGRPRRMLCPGRHVRHGIVRRRRARGPHGGDGVWTPRDRDAASPVYRS